MLGIVLIEVFPGLLILDRGENVGGDLVLFLGRQTLHALDRFFEEAGYGFRISQGIRRLPPFPKVPRRSNSSLGLDSG